jgi:hypothetical protein
MASRGVLSNLQQNKLNKKKCTNNVQTIYKQKIQVEMIFVFFIRDIENS